VAVGYVSSESSSPIGRPRDRRIGVCFSTNPRAGGERHRHGAEASAPQRLRSLRRFQGLRHVTRKPLARGHRGRSAALMGSFYRPKYRASDGTVKESAVIWLKYRDALGVLRRESSGTEKEQEARRVLRRKEGAAEAGRVEAPRADKITVAQ